MTWSLGWHADHTLASPWLPVRGDGGGDGGGGGGEGRRMRKASQLPHWQSHGSQGNTVERERNPASFHPSRHLPRCHLHTKLQI